MAQQFTGTVEILNAERGLGTIVLDGGEIDERGGSLKLGGNGLNGGIEMFDLTGRRRLFVSAHESVPSLELEGKLSIFKQDGLQINGFQPFITLRDTNAVDANSVVQGVNGDLVLIPHSFIGTGAAMVLKTGSGNVGIGTSNPSSKLEVVGDVRANNVNCSDVTLQNADCAEDFDIADPDSAEPGTVMVLGDEGALYQSHQPYDKRVAGVVSGAGDYKPGIVLDKRQSLPNRKAIALLGKVYCKVDSQYSPVEVGDLLTTSSTPGHAMKATDSLRAFGAVIGKALRSLRKGQGLIPILIALQ